MSTGDTRLDTFRGMVAKNPDNALARFGLANEAAKAGLFEEALEHYEEYLRRHDDEGNGWARAAELFEKLGRIDEAKDARRKGIAAAHRFGHPSMRNELELRLEELEDS